MGDASDTLVEDLRAAVRERVGAVANESPAIVDVVTDAVCEFWPSRFMGEAARREQTEELEDQVVLGLSVVEAKIAETLEARYGASGNDRHAIEILLGIVLQTIAAWWFEDAGKRMSIRRVIWRVRHG